MGECQRQKHTQHMKTECDYLYGWIKHHHKGRDFIKYGEFSEIKLRTQKEKKNKFKTHASLIFQEHPRWDKSLSIPAQNFTDHHTCPKSLVGKAPASSTGGCDSSHNQVMPRHLLHVQGAVIPVITKSSQGTCFKYRGL